MFNLGPEEIILILVIALIVFGPKRLPEIGRTLGRSLREFRRASEEIKGQLDLGLGDDPAEAQVAERRYPGPEASTEPIELPAGGEQANGDGPAPEDAGPRSSGAGPVR